MRVLTFDEYRIKRTQLALANGIIKTAEFKTMEEFIRFDGYRESLKIDCVEYEQSQAEKAVFLYGIQGTA